MSRSDLCRKTAFPRAVRWLLQPFALLFLASTVTVEGFLLRQGETRTKWPLLTPVCTQQIRRQLNIKLYVESHQDSRSYVANYETFGDGALASETFEELYGGEASDEDDGDGNYLPSWLTDRCEECGWNHPTLVQQRALDAIMIDKDDIVLQAQTGSGKTLAYLLPLLARIDGSRSAVQALIVVPTRELGLQVGRVAKRLAAGVRGKGTDDTDGARKDDKIMIMNVLQGSQNKRQRAWAWADPPQVVIGTPEELTNMVRFGGIRYNSVSYVVIDEVDACLLNNAGSMVSNMAGAGPLHELLSRHLSPTFEIADKRDEISALFSLSNAPPPREVSDKRQTVFCSATIPQHRHFLRQCVKNQWTLREPKYICASPGELIPPTLDHAYVVCASKEKKFAAMRRLLTQKLPNLCKVLIFCEPDRPMEEMAMIIANDLNGILWREGYGVEEEESARAIVSVLRYEDSLSLRASAMMGFLGIDGGSIEGRRFDEGVVAQNDRPKNRRDEAMKIRVLLSTDLAARGLDADVSHVLNFDLPHDADTYVHRGGRAGRLGKQGLVLSLVTKDQEFVVERLSNKLSLDLKCIARQKRERNKDRLTP